MRIQRKEELLPTVRISEGWRLKGHMSLASNPELDFHRQGEKWQQVNTGDI